MTLEPGPKIHLRRFSDRMEAFRLVRGAERAAARVESPIHWQMLRIENAVVTHLLARTPHP